MPVAAPADKRFRRAHVTPKGRRAWRRPSWWTLARMTIVLLLVGFGMYRAVFQEKGFVNYPGKLLE